MEIFAGRAGWYVAAALVTCALLAGPNGTWAQTTSGTDSGGTSADNSQGGTTSGTGATDGTQGSSTQNQQGGSRSGKSLVMGAPTKAAAGFTPAATGDMTNVGRGGPIVGGTRSGTSSNNNDNNQQNQMLNYGWTPSQTGWTVGIGSSQNDNGGNTGGSTTIIIGGNTGSNTTLVVGGNTNGGTNTDQGATDGTQGSSTQNQQGSSRSGKSLVMGAPTKAAAGFTPAATGDMTNVGRGGPIVGGTRSGTSSSNNQQNQVLNYGWSPQLSGWTGGMSWDQTNTNNGNQVQTVGNQVQTVGNQVQTIGTSARGGADLRAVRVPSGTIYFQGTPAGSTGHRYATTSGYSRFMDPRPAPVSTAGTSATPAPAPVRVTTAVRAVGKADLRATSVKAGHTSAVRSHTVKGQVRQGTRRLNNRRQAITASGMRSRTPSRVIRPTRPTRSFHVTRPTVTAARATSARIRPTGSGVRFYHRR
ncbi:MAG: hypothetical protein J7M21_05470 [Planctomycetes bacterium]|nr:hypothetical protein [Planctomycetota bacterium]